MVLIFVEEFVFTAIESAQMSQKPRRKSTPVGLLAVLTARGAKRHESWRVFVIDHFVETSPWRVVCVVRRMDGLVRLGDALGAERSAEAWSARVEMMRHAPRTTSRLDPPASAMVENVGLRLIGRRSVAHGRRLPSDRRPPVGSGNTRALSR
ncbi:hypothetical protein ACGFRB_13640 [Streptomyces sp. NPDC048718]|uniref:hypothetical protein n=1 Tax=Streptomyces sp. NPDC048718 TaxID=3365587 RepID=UPI003716E81F